MKWTGATINSMTLGGMAIAVGAIVDDAIIDVENVFRRLRENALRPEGERSPVLEVVYRGSSEIRGSIVFATLVIGLVFVPLFFLHGVEGRLLRPLGFAYLVALFASLFVALTVTPVLCAVLLPNSKAVRSGREPRWLTGLKNLYGRLLETCLDHGRSILVGAGVLLLAAIASFFWMGRAFLPEFNEGTLTLSAVTLPGTSLEESDKLGAAVERLLLEVPEVTATGRRTGRAELDEHLLGVESAEIDVNLELGDRSKEQVLEDIRQRLSLVPGTNVTVGQPISHRIDHMLSGTRAEHRGQDLRARIWRCSATWPGKWKRWPGGSPGAVDVAVEAQANIPTVQVHFDRAGPGPLRAAGGCGGGDDAYRVRRPRGGADLRGPGRLSARRSLSRRATGETSTRSAGPASTRPQAPGSRWKRWRRSAKTADPTSSAARTASARSSSRPTSPAATCARWWTISGMRWRRRWSFPRATRSSTAGSSRARRDASRRLLWLGLTVMLGILVLLVGGVPIAAATPSSSCSTCRWR